MRHQRRWFPGLVSLAVCVIPADAYKVNAHNQLRFATPSSALDFSGTATTMLSAHILHAALLLLHLIIGSTISWGLRWAQLLALLLIHVALLRIDRTRVVRHLLLSRGHRTLWPARTRVVGVAGRTTNLLLRVHARWGQTGLRSVWWRRGACGGSRSVRRADSVVVNIDSALSL